jgi:murein DD-endopeptidase MepM/ murein hydrolase activator NlpD
MLHKTAILLFTIFILSSCAEMFLKPYGQVTPDAANVRVGSISLPEGAPTIAQGYNPRPSDDSGATPGAGHEGIDIYAKTGTPVIAPASGIVIDSSFEPFYGNHIVIDHGRDEKGRIIRSKLLHLDTRLVEKGEVVIRGERIGTLGSTGLLASYPHLHFEIRFRNNSDRNITTPLNPHSFWFDGVGVVTCFDKSKEWPDIPFRTTYPVVCR